MRWNLSTNGVIAVITGIAIIAWAVWGFSALVFDLFSAGLLFFGSGLILFGVTDGFNDQSHKGRMLFKIGILIFIAAFLLLGYFFIRII